MKQIFTPWNFGSLTLPNRLIRSATWEGMADRDGLAGDRLVHLYRRLAEGGVGLIITGYAYVRPEGKSTPGQLGIYSDRHIPGLARIAEAVHAAGGRAIVQIVHGGGQCQPAVSGASETLAPSALSYPPHATVARAITPDEIPVLVEAFADAARRAMAAGFDGVQIHGAHGYLISRFLSPKSNRRDDRYGGDAVARARFGLEIVQAVRRAIGDAPLSMKLNGSDFEDGGLELDEALAAAKLYAQAGLDHLEISGGTPAAGKLAAARPGIRQPDQEAYFRSQAAAIKGAVAIPTGIVGGIRSINVAENLVASGDADTVSLCRPLICEPHLPARWLSGDERPSICKSDSGCALAARKGGVTCVIHELDELFGVPEE